MAEINGEIPGQLGGNPEMFPTAPGTGAPTAPVGFENLEYAPNKYLLAPVITTVSLVLRGTRTFFEMGGKDDIRAHRDNGGSLLMIVSHASRWDTVAIAPITRTNEPLQHVQYNTGITAREEIFDIPVVGGVVKRSGAQKVKRSLENPDESEEEKADRQKDNEGTQGGIGRVLASGGNGLVFGEGISKVPVTDKSGKALYGPDGKPIRRPRKPGEVLPVRKGFVYSLKSMTPEERKRVKLLGIAIYHGDRRFSGIRGTVAIPRPVDPLEGDYGDKDFQELVRQQGDDLLRRGMADAARLDRERR